MCLLVFVASSWSVQMEKVQVHVSALQTDTSLSGQEAITL